MSSQLSAQWSEPPWGKIRTRTCLALQQAIALPTEARCTLQDLHKINEGKKF
jgi:hypothetical protein